MRNDEGPLCRSCNEAIDCSTLNFSLKCLKKNWKSPDGRTDAVWATETFNRLLNVKTMKRNRKMCTLIKKNFWFLPSNRSWRSRTGVERCWTENMDEADSTTRRLWGRPTGLCWPYSSCWLVSQRFIQIWKLKCIDLSIKLIDFNCTPFDSCLSARFFLVMSAGFTALSSS